MKKIVVVSTNTNGGGGIVLHLLCRMLRERGFSAQIFRMNYIPIQDGVWHYVKFLLKVPHFWVKRIVKKLKKWFQQEYVFDEPIKCPSRILPYVDKDTIVVYPDVVYGNPLRAKKVVRWFLYHNRFPNNPEAYGKNELVFSFREHFNDYNLNPSCRLLTLNYFDKDLYKQTNFGERSGACYIIRKGKNRPDLPKTFDGPVIDDLPEKEKVAVLNRCKYCYDYDTQTFYTSIACVCGCIPIVVMEPGKAKEDYLGKGDKDWGKAYGDTPKEIEYAIETRPLRLKMLDFDEQNKKNVDFFVKEVQNFFSKVN